VLLGNTGEEFLRFASGVVQCPVKIPRLFPLAIVPVSDVVDLGILFGPFFEGTLNGWGKIGEPHGGGTAVLAEKSGFDDIPGEKGQ